ncbi:MAG: 16S rRNA (cytosine(1402)-N(4))-methyltransferase RsmH [Microcoleaceae cyanobacterium]
MSDPSTASVFHIPVLSRELMSGLNLQPHGEYLVATVGGGGHSCLFLQSSPEVRVTAIDQDSQALAAAQTKLQATDPSLLERIQFWQGNFCDYEPGTQEFDGIIADLGINSNQLDTPERGFSFRQTASLDMRMNQQQSLTAAEIINTWDEVELADLFYQYGEERLSRRIARQVVGKRPFETTTDLAAAISQSVPPKYRYGRIHPATRVFQALRIVVNQELVVLEKFLQLAPKWLKPAGRIGVISFHSLEDRRVKHAFRQTESLKIITKKPIQPQSEEIDQNPRARSAKLRIAERLDHEVGNIT